MLFLLCLISTTSVTDFIIPTNLCIPKNEKMGNGKINVGVYIVKLLKVPKDISEVQMKEINVGILRNKVVENPDAANTSSMTKFLNLNRFDVNDKFTFGEGLSDVVVKSTTREGYRIRFVFVNCSGLAKKYYCSSIHKAVREVSSPQIAGMRLEPTGNIYVANYEDFDPPKDHTSFGKVAAMFPNELSSYKSLAKNNVSVKIVNIKYVLSIRFNIQTEIAV